MIYNPENLWAVYGFDLPCPVVAVFFNSNDAVDMVLHDSRRLYVGSYAVPSFAPTWWAQYPPLGEMYGKAA